MITPMSNIYIANNQTCVSSKTKVKLVNIAIKLSATAYSTYFRSLPQMQATIPQCLYLVDKCHTY